MVPGGDGGGDSLQGFPGQCRAVIWHLHLLLVSWRYPNMPFSFWIRSWLKINRLLPWATQILLFYFQKIIIQINIYLVILAGKETICSLWEWFHFIATLNCDIVILQSFISETVNETLHNLAQSNLQFLSFWRFQ